MAPAVGPTGPEWRLPSASLPPLSLFLHMENGGGVCITLDPMTFQDFENLVFEKVLHIHPVHNSNKRMQ